ncbi:MAG TPA: hypothetical protein VES40_08900 [Ilumatobacteraceae bacterium]|nr:hypothetical protein [Ilumatobacteraceae bacterium]
MTKATGRPLSASIADKTCATPLAVSSGELGRGAVDDVCEESSGAS